MLVEEMVRISHVLTSLAPNHYDDYSIIYIGRVPHDDKTFHLGELTWFLNPHFLILRDGRAVANFTALDTIASYGSVRMRIRCYAIEVPPVAIPAQAGNRSLGGLPMCSACVIYL
jgi:hypothetical protein